ncbi:hypothetical protein HDU76_008111, partial [Blyttiomyces sp. JEL0837]
TTAPNPTQPTKSTTNTKPSTPSTPSKRVKTPGHQHNTNNYHFSPELEITESETSYNILIDVPGVQRTDISVSVDGNYNDDGVPVLIFEGVRKVVSYGEVDSEVNDLVESNEEKVEDNVANTEAAVMEVDGGATTADQHDVNGDGNGDWEHVDGSVSVSEKKEEVNLNDNTTSNDVAITETVESKDQEKDVGEVDISPETLQQESVETEKSTTATTTTTTEAPDTTNTNNNAKSTTTPQNVKHIWKERKFGSFKRVIKLPKDADLLGSMKAKMENGVLEIVVLKKTPYVKKVVVM